MATELRAKLVIDAETEGEIGQRAEREGEASAEPEQRRRLDRRRRHVAQRGNAPGHRQIQRPAHRHRDAEPSQRVE